MDPTTQAHIDPRTLTQSQGEFGQIPSLKATSGAYSLSQPSGPGADLYALDAPQPAVSSKFGNALDDTTPHGTQPGSHNPFVGSGNGGTGPSTGTDSLPSSNQARDTANQAASTVQSKANNAADTINSNIPSTNDIKSKANDVASKIPSKDDIKNSDTATGIRQRVNTLGDNLNQASQNVGANVNQASATVQQKLEQASHHPVVENAKQGAQAQVGQFRQYLGRSPTIVKLERRLNIDRVFLVAGGAFLYLLLIPLNLFGLALPTTTLLTLVPPVLLAIQILDQDNMQDDTKTKSLLAYFVVLGFIQFLESLAAGVLAKRIPQYYTVKLIFLAYLLHPQTRGALKFHEAVLKPTFSQPASATRSSFGNVGNTSSNSATAGYSTSSSGYNTNTTPPQSNTQGSSAASSPFVGQMPVRGTVDAQGNITSIQPTKGEFEVLTSGQ